VTLAVIVSLLPHVNTSGKVDSLPHEKPPPKPTS